jgi:hypothetical protein
MEKLYGCVGKLYGKVSRTQPIDPHEALVLELSQGFGKLVEGGSPEETDKVLDILVSCHRLLRALGNLVGEQQEFLEEIEWRAGVWCCHVLAWSLIVKWQESQTRLWYASAHTVFHAGAGCYHC